MYTQYELVEAIDVESVNRLIPDPWPHTLLVGGIELGSTVGIFSIDSHNEIKETLLLVKDMKSSYLELRISATDKVMVRMRKRGILPYESTIVRGSSIVVCVAIEDRMY